MSSPYAQALDEALANFRHRREQLADTQQKLATVSATATAPRQVVTATVARGGEVTELKFPTSAYKKMAPAELAAVVLKTINEARAEVLDRTAELLAPMLPPGLDARDVVNGRARMDAVFGSDPRLAEESAR